MVPGCTSPLYESAIVGSRKQLSSGLSDWRQKEAMMLHMLEKLIENYGGEYPNALLNRRRIRVLVHRAFIEDSQKEAFFITITNLTLDREIEVTHIWFNSHPKIHVIRNDRVLPKKLKPNETWDTWLPVNKLPTGYHPHAFTMVRVRLSNGSLAYSELNLTPPEKGTDPVEMVNFD